MATLFLFRRDLRTTDNTALDASNGTSAGVVVPAFVVDPRQADPSLNPYHGARAARFLAESLESLERQLGRRLAIATAGPDGSQRGALDRLTRESPIPIVAVAWNADHTPYARRRDAEVLDWCRERGVEAVVRTGDYSLVDPTTMEKPYQVFSPFHRRYHLLIDRPRRTKTKRNTMRAKRSAKRVDELRRLFHGADEPAEIVGGREEALAILARVRRGDFSDATYGSGGRDDLGAPAGAGTTRLSAYLKFGCVSVREAHAAAVASGSLALAREMMFRAFYDQIVYHFPRTLEGMNNLLIFRKNDGTDGKRKNRSLREAYDRVEWRTGAAAERDVEAWRRGRTGVPVVDAGMRQLEATGFVHNRARMVVASFLVKDLHVDWRVGERHFATRLVDYDPSANNQGWTFVSGGGADAQPYTRAFNPWRQARRFDAECRYVKRWVPELAHVPVADLLRWDEAAVREGYSLDYPRDPIVLDHAAEARRAKEDVRRALHP